MDRNTVTATVLITLIIVGWLYFFSPPPPIPSGSEQAVEDSLYVEEEAEADVPTLRSMDDDGADVDSSFASATVGQEQIVTVEHDLFTAQFSTKGARLVSFKLKEYQRADRVSPVQLVDTTAPGNGLACHLRRRRAATCRRARFTSSRRSVDRWLRATRS